MQLRPDQIGAALSKSLLPVYLVCGDEPLQVMEAADSIRAAARAQEYLEREVLDVDKNFEWQALLDAAATLSLFASRRLLDLRIPSGKPGREGSQALKQYLERPAEDTLLLITSGKLDGASKNTAWFKAIDKAGAVIQCWPVGPDRLPAWVKQRFLASQMQPEPEVVDYVCQHVEGNLLAAAQEIDKLYLILGPGKVSLDNVREAITENSRFTVFELVDTALQGDRARVMRILHGLAGEGVEPIIANWALAKDIRLLAQVAADPGSLEYSLKRSGVWASRVPLFKACLQRHSKIALQRMLKRCAFIDQAIKGVAQANVWDELRGLGYALAGSSRRH
jgi:DNA polymerase-3 subunit delta